MWWVVVVEAVAVIEVVAVIEPGGVIVMVVVVFLVMPDSAPWHCVSGLIFLQRFRLLFGAVQVPVVSTVPYPLTLLHRLIFS